MGTFGEVGNLSWERWDETREVGRSLMAEESVALLGASRLRAGRGDLTKAAE